MEIPSIIKSSVPKTYLKKKGDLATAKDDGQLETVSVGPDGTVLTADSSQPTGFKWISEGNQSGLTNWGGIVGDLSDQADLGNALNNKEPANTNIQAHIATIGNPHGTTSAEVGLGNVTNEAQIPKNIGTTKGSLLGFSGSGTPVEVPVGADNMVLMADSSQPSGVAWKDALGGAAAWGSIAGTLSNQADLQTALQNKSNVNHTHISSQVGLGNVTDDKQVKAATTATDGNLVSWSGNSGDTVVDSGKKAADFAAASHAHTPGQVGLGDVTNDAQVKKASASVDSNLVVWSGTTGDMVTDSGKQISDLALANHNHDGIYEPTNANIQSHIGSTANPHNVTADQTLPNQTGNNGKFLVTNGTTVSWSDPSAGTPPTGNGFRHITDGAEDTAAKLVADADVAPAAAIAESKLSLTYPTHSNANDPATGQKAALAGTSGTPDAGNLYVTDADPRNTNARTPTVHGSSAHTGTIGTPTQVGLSNVPNVDATNPANITQDATYRFTTDTEKTTWNGKQDVLGYTPVPTTRQVNGHPLSADVTVTKADLGLSNVTNDAQIAKSIGAAKGDIIGFSATATPGVLAKGTNGHVLTLDDSQTLGVKWASGVANWPDITNKPDKYLNDYPGANGEAKLLAALTAIGSTPVSLHINTPVTLSAIFTTIPANIYIKPHPSNLITISPGCTLTIRGGLELVPFQVFNDLNTGYGCGPGRGVAITLTVSGATATVSRSSGSFIYEALTNASYVTFGGFATNPTNNNTFGPVSNVTATSFTVPSTNLSGGLAVTESTGYAAYVVPGVKFAGQYPTTDPVYVNMPYVSPDWWGAKQGFNADYTINTKAFNKALKVHGPYNYGNSAIIPLKFAGGYALNGTVYLVCNSVIDGGNKSTSGLSLATNSNVVLLDIYQADNWEIKNFLLGAGTSNCCKGLVWAHYFSTDPGRNYKVHNLYLETSGLSQPSWSLYLDANDGEVYDINGTTKNGIFAGGTDGGCLHDIFITGSFVSGVTSWSTTGIMVGGPWKVTDCYCQGFNNGFWLRGTAPVMERCRFDICGIGINSRLETVSVDHNWTGNGRVIPAVGPYTVTINDMPAGCTYVKAMTVRLSSGTTFINGMHRTTGTPGPGQYSENTTTRVLTFNAADAGKPITVNYLMVVPGSGADQTNYLTNVGPIGGGTIAYAKISQNTFSSGAIGINAGVGVPTIKDNYFKQQFSGFIADKDGNSIGIRCEEGGYFAENTFEGQDNNVVALSDCPPECKNNIGIDLTNISRNTAQLNVSGDIPTIFHTTLASLSNTSKNIARSGVGSNGYPVGGAGVAVAVSGGNTTFTRNDMGGSWIADGVQAANAATGITGSFIKFSGFANAGNNATFGPVSAVTATTLTVPTSTAVNESLRSLVSSVQTCQVTGLGPAAEGHKLSLLVDSNTTLIKHSNVGFHTFTFDGAGNWIDQTAQSAFNYFPAAAPKSATVTLSIVSSNAVVVRDSGSWVTDGCVATHGICFEGFANYCNNTTFVIGTISTTTNPNDTLTFPKKGAIAEGPVTVTFNHPQIYFCDDKVKFNSILLNMASAYAADNVKFVWEYLGVENLGWIGTAEDAPAWQPSTSYSMGQCVRQSSGYREVIYICKTSGVSGTVEPFFSGSQSYGEYRPAPISEGTTQWQPVYPLEIINPTAFKDATPGAVEIRFKLPQGPSETKCRAYPGNTPGMFPTWSSQPLRYTIRCRVYNVVNPTAGGAQQTDKIKRCNIRLSTATFNPTVQGLLKLVHRRHAWIEVGRSDY
jgi:hypothetical protein